jgi:hypothetical protein
LREGCGKRYFFESAGGGLLADYLRDAKGTPKKTKQLSEDQEMRRQVSLLRRMLHDYSARKWKMDIDGKDISDEYILWPRKSERRKVRATSKSRSNHRRS